MFESGESTQASAAITAARDTLARLGRELGNATRIDLIRALEELKSSCAAAQAVLTADLSTDRRAEHAAAGVPTAQRGRGVSAEIGLARRESPKRGSQFLGLANVLVHEMPHTLALLRSGHLNEWRAMLLVRETACLSKADRARVDRDLCGRPERLEGMGDAKIIAAARAAAAELDVAAVVRRNARAVADRHVSVRPAPDTMSYVSALLPVKEGVSVYAALRRDADTVIAAGDERSRAQIMADLLVERVTGQASATSAPIAVNVVISDHALFGDGDEPAHVVGYGPIPAAIARDWIKNAAAEEDSPETVQLRRVYAHPGSGALTAMESKSRCFPKPLARLIDIRDRVCRTPWCGAPIRHRDHIEPHEAGGATTVDNGAGVCEACNHAKQAPGWSSRPEHRTPAARHRYSFTTPTGHNFKSTAPPLPKPYPLGIEIYTPTEQILVDFLACN